MKKNLKNGKKSKSQKEGQVRSAFGMHDILPKDAELWKDFYKVGYSISELHNFYITDLSPVELFSLMEPTVSCRDDKKCKRAFKLYGDSVVLYPRRSASMMRSYLEHHLGYFASPLRTSFFGPVFPERVSKHNPNDGMFHEWGFEIIGDTDPLYDMEVLLASIAFLKSLKIKDFSIKVNTSGCRSCGKQYFDRLKSFFASRKSQLCAECAKKCDEFPFSVLGCSNEKCIELRESTPIVLDYLCQNCNNHFKAFLELIEDNNIQYEPDPYFLKDMKGCNRMLFGIFSKSGSELVYGNRHDYLSEIIAGRQIPAVGSSINLERIAETIRLEEIQVHTKQKKKVFFIAVGDQAKKVSTRLMEMLRSNGVVVAEAIGKRSLKAQLKAAEKVKAQTAIFVGQKEAFEETVLVRDMVSGAQETVILAKMVDEIKKRM